MPAALPNTVGRTFQEGPLFYQHLIVIYLEHPHMYPYRASSGLSERWHKTATHRSLRYFQSAALMPSAGTITLQIELYAARVPTAPALRTSVRWFQRISSYGKAKAMQVPSAVKPACWGAVGGAIALAIVGFHWGGWMTSHAAGKFADERADVAVVAALTPICVDKFQHDADAAANLVALKVISLSWEQGKFIEKGGWATRPGATSPDYALGRACAERLVLAKTAAQ
jgi:hypothetical protein